MEGPSSDYATTCPGSSRATRAEDVSTRRGLGGRLREARGWAATSELSSSKRSRCSGGVGLASNWTAGRCRVRTRCASGGPEAEQMTAARIGAPWRWSPSAARPGSVRTSGGGVVEEPAGLAARASSSGSRTLLHRSLRRRSFLEVPETRPGRAASCGDDRHDGYRPEYGAHEQADLAEQLRGP